MYKTFAEGTRVLLWLGYRLLGQRFLYHPSLEGCFNFVLCHYLQRTFGLFSLPTCCCEIEQLITWESFVVSSLLTPKMTIPIHITWYTFLSDIITYVTVPVDEWQSKQSTLGDLLHMQLSLLLQEMPWRESLAYAQVYILIKQVHIQKCCQWYSATYGINLLEC